MKHARKYLHHFLRFDVATQMFLCEHNSPIKKKLLGTPIEILLVNDLAILAIRRCKAIIEHNKMFNQSTWLYVLVLRTMPQRITHIDRVTIKLLHIVTDSDLESKGERI